MLEATQANPVENFKCGCGCTQTASAIKKVPGNNNAPMQAVAVCANCGSDANVVMGLQNQIDELKDELITLMPKKIFEQTKSVEDRNTRLKLMRELNS